MRKRKLKTARDSNLELCRLAAPESSVLPIELIVQHETNIAKTRPSDFYNNDLPNYQTQIGAITI